MKKIIIIAGMIIMGSATIWAQDATQSNTRNRDQDKTQMQKDESNNNKKAKKSTNRKNKSKKTSDEEALKMDQYESNKQTNSGSREEQRHMDSTINNHK